MQEDSKGKQRDAIRVRDLVVTFGDANVLERLSLEVVKGEILGLVGGSGSGKSVLLRTIIGLIPKRQGTIEVLGIDLDTVSDADLRALERRWGILFQQGALFSSLSVRENVKFPMRQYLSLSPGLEHPRAEGVELIDVAHVDRQRARVRPRRALDESLELGRVNGRPRAARGKLEPIIDICAIE
jgi:ABC-type transporter Mla maintaining outer membrane lipid asymmetry ATPase subunit MlaF